jgi:uncharacterized OB-fold protein
MAVVALDEGVRMIGELKGVEPHGDLIGSRVELVLDQVADDLTLAAWKLAEEGAK